MPNERGNMQPYSFNYVLRANFNENANRINFSLVSPHININLTICKQDTYNYRNKLLSLFFKKISCSSLAFETNQNNFFQLEEIANNALYMISIFSQSYSYVKRIEHLNEKVILKYYFSKNVLPYLDQKNFIEALCRRWVFEPFELNKKTIEDLLYFFYKEGFKIKKQD